MEFCRALLTVVDLSVGQRRQASSLLQLRLIQTQLQQESAQVLPCMMLSTNLRTRLLSLHSLNSTPPPTVHVDVLGPRGSTNCDPPGRWGKGQVRNGKSSRVMRSCEIRTNSLQPAFNQWHAAQPQPQFFCRGCHLSLSLCLLSVSLSLSLPLTFGSRGEGRGGHPGSNSANPTTSAPSQKYTTVCPTPLNDMGS